ncbi:transcriptional regulator, PaaX family [Streptoalloteichus tenebrarius]|uniref:Transcriptional regulator, PaaX family n=1 Tax=Streptoalloteichus tenebrarius (strain ATCC 17920 / DSM 40477 / JCM 4838 / CBS 697.72 / NBRC 16177 / NCIMB 11028 / NRRL B-12390 / A12253. 1 / ISP 5477) TaxID=1933 RepID=A0ABT1HYT3_STRSD|nr:PaaX family transcriptional regulator C-terminal domain-containing protein [Streptoalloteichus tenebrarius]MCP2260688.1 transcriptional regulator, PaaX family [Streptoalloteichus tenebrarius]BFF03779.1 PaaX family transcriptional regulator C-terminal domain-containing protein [Streptoalloteichus tenebrarius]
MAEGTALVRSPGDGAPVESVEPDPAFAAQPQDLVITLLGAHVHPRDRARVWSGGLVSLLAEFGFSAGAARVALARLVRRELLARVREGRFVHYALTPRALAVLDEGDRRIFTLGRGAGGDTWTTLWHAIPEDQRLARARLVRRLRFLGFGPVQDGAWLAPHDREREVTALLEELGVTPHAGVLLGRPTVSAGFRALVARVWDLDELAGRYAAFVAEFGRPRDGAPSDREAFLLRTRLVHTFRQFAFLDPELPEDVAPPPAHRAEAVRLFHDLYTALDPGARRHFDRAVTP